MCIYVKRTKMPTCTFCNFFSDDVVEYKRHLRRKECIQSRNYLFVCKRCDYTGHSLSQIKSHCCDRMYYEHNIVESLRNRNIGPVLTTKARTEWLKLKTLLNKLPPQVNPSLLNTKSEIVKCQKLNVNPLLVYAVKEGLKWLKVDSCDLGQLTHQNICFLQKNLYIVHRYFNYTINRQVDARHFFKLLLAKTECVFWPFLLSMQEIVHLVFGHQLCPLKRDLNGNFFILQTNNVLFHPLEDTRIYSDFVWKRSSAKDIYRFVYSEWIQPMFENIIVYLRDESRENILTNFIAFWTNSSQVVASISIENNLEVTNEIFEFNTIAVSFENLVKQHAKQYYGEIVASLEMSQTQYAVS